VITLITAPAARPVQYFRPSGGCQMAIEWPVGDRGRDVSAIIALIHPAQSCYALAGALLTRAVICGVLSVAGLLALPGQSSGLQPIPLPWRDGGEIGPQIAAILPRHRRVHSSRLSRMPVALGQSHRYAAGAGRMAHWILQVNPETLPDLR
jgi:hypothetical protein